MRDIALAIGRIALVAVFIAAGIEKLTGMGAAAAYIGAKGLPLPFGGMGIIAAAGIAALVEIVGGLMIAVGFWTRLAAMALAAFTVVATFLFHDFWNMAGALRATNMLAAMKDAGLAGGLLVLAAAGPGRLSIDGWRQARHPHASV